MNQKIIRKGQQENKKSKLQRKYENLLKNIDLRQKQHNNLTEGLRVVIPRVMSELQPLAKEEAEWQIKKLVRLDEIVDDVTISRNKKDIFATFIVQEAIILLNSSHPDHEDLKKIYAKYTGEDFDVENDKFDSEFDNLGFESDIFDEFDEENSYLEKKSSKESKKKTKKPSKLGLKKEEEEKILALDAKAIYFRLIKKYHPDRQQDPEKQKEYTEISKQVTKAYKDNDFMSLLRLQIEYLDENENDAQDLAEDMLQRYNKILQAQLSELDNSLNIVKFSSMGLVDDFFDENYLFSEKLYQNTLKQIRRNIEDIKADIEKSHIEKKDWLKKWLKEAKEILEIRAMELMFSSFR